jgi:hypothetical protein
MTSDDINRVARKYLKPGEMTVLVVGDRKVVEPELKELPFAQDLYVLDPEGNPKFSRSN